jgi:hypothetical protein
LVQRRRRFKHHFITKKHSVIEISEGNGNKFRASKLNISNFFLFDNHGNIAEIAKQVIDIFYFQVIKDLKTQDSILLLQFVFNLKRAGNFRLIGSIRKHLLVLCRVRF